MEVRVKQETVDWKKNCLQEIYVSVEQNLLTKSVPSGQDEERSDLDAFKYEIKIENFNADEAPLELQDAVSPEPADGGQVHPTESTHFTERRDLQTSTSKSSSPFRCDVFNYLFKMQQTLKIHKLSHADKMDIACDQCSYECNVNSNLTKHKLTHSGKKLFACEQCLYKCSTKNSLIKHGLTHSGEKPFACDHCVKSGNLPKHKLVLCGEKRFTCDQCSYMCNFKTSLISHKLTHGDNELFNCDQCPYKCNKKGNLRSHKLSHKEEMTFS